MNETGEGEGASPDDAAAAAYFRLLEEAFVTLRGSAALLSPADWAIAERWFRAGIPGELVIATLEDVWRRRRERSGPAARISSLRYFAPAVDAAWEEVSRLTAPGRRWSLPTVPVDESLRLLADRLPESLPDRGRWCSEILSLVGLSAQAAEAALLAIEPRLLSDLESAFDAEATAAVDREVERLLAPVRPRLTADQIAESASRLRTRVLRQRGGLPVLSLFFLRVDATPGDSATS